MQFGYFDDSAREYVITDPRTPVKWINYIGTLAFGGFVDHTGGALICKGDPALNRITRYIALLPASDFRGETLYLRVWDDSGMRLFSPFYTPCLAPYQSWECRVGLGYTTIRSRVGDIQSEVTMFVPPGAAVEVRDIRIQNLGSRPVEVDAVPVVEYTHFDSLKQLTNADWVPQTMQSRAERDGAGRVVLAQYAFMRRETHINYFTSNLPVDSFETDRRAFLGLNEYGTWAHPAALDDPSLGNGQALRGDNVGVLLHRLGSLPPGESRRLITLLGQECSLDAARPLIERYRDPAAVDAAFAALRAGWQTTLHTLQVNTPDAALNSMLNVHNPRQCDVTLNWSRYLSLYQLGYGARGIGVRDSAQDVMGALLLRPAQAKDLLRKLMMVQKRDGSAMHQFNPLTMVASVGDAHERDDRPQYYSDDGLWIVLAVCAYLKESGDFAFLDEEIPYYDKNRAGEALESAAVIDHLRRALAFTRQDCGAHGLPHLGFADWNDTINLATGAESLLTAALYGRGLLEMIALYRHLDDPGAAADLQADYEEMRAAVNRHAWDGEWYVSYFDADGTPLGSKQNEAGQIYLYGQAWPVLAGFAPVERAQSALDAAHQRLNTRFGLKLSAPGFNGFDPRKGGITTYPPGAKENGGIFLHVNPWVIIAETLLGRGERAYQYYAQINPAGRNDQIEVYECEPYVYPQNILADEHPQFGLARNSWLSGTAAWMYQAGTQWLLGVRPAYAGLEIDPCIPPHWPGFTLSREFRGARYEIRVSNSRGISKGVRSLLVDGVRIEGNLAPLFGDGKTHQVEVVLGK